MCGREACEFSTLCWCVFKCLVFLLVFLFYIHKQLPTSLPQADICKKHHCFSPHLYISVENVYIPLGEKMLMIQYTMIIIKIPLEIFRIFYILIFQDHEDNKTL